jgi:hypothetical protein
MLAAPEHFVLIIWHDFMTYNSSSNRDRTTNPFNTNLWSMSLLITLHFFVQWLPAHSGPTFLIQFHNHFSQSVGLLGRVTSTSQGRYLHTGQHKSRIKAYTYQTSMPWTGFEPTISASEWAKIIHALDGAATVTDNNFTLGLHNKNQSLDDDSAANPKRRVN